MGTDTNYPPDLPCEVNYIHAEEEITALLHGKYELYIGKVLWERFIRTEGMRKDYYYF